jgi:hypothetical protein
MELRGGNTSTSTGSILAVRAASRSTKREQKDRDHDCADERQGSGGIQMGQRPSHTDDELHNGLTDEERIRADERSRVEEELNTLDTGSNAHDQRAVVVDDDTPAEGTRFARPPDDDHGRPVGYDRVARDDGLVRDEAEERFENDDRIVVQQDEPIEVLRTRSFSVGQLLSLITGAALIALGIVALVKTGIDTPLDQPVEPVLGWDHTPLLGIVELVAGALLVLFSLRPGGRWIVALVGMALVIGGVLILGELDWTVDELGAEQEFAWVPIVAGLVAIVASLLTPRRHQKVTGVPVTQ